MTRFLGTTQVRLAGGPEEIYLYRKPVIKEVIKTEEEKALEIARKLRTWEKAHDIFYGPERDFKNFPHPKRVDKPGKHHLGFIPHSWFLALYPKLGVMGESLHYFLELLKIIAPNKVLFSSGCFLAQDDLL